MSLMKRADVKNHLSARHRTEIHVAPSGKADASGLPRDTGDDPKVTNSVESSSRIPDPGASTTAPTVMPTGQSKSVKA
jgi:hypothetical protein